MQGILSFAKILTAGVLQKGEVAIDATVGNGHDTLFLARQVAPQGTVYGFDIQAEALEAARQRLKAGDALDRVVLLRKGHEALREAVPEQHHGRVGAVMFNLGYLPGGPDKSIITRKETTLPALVAATEMLRAGGLLTAVLYPGHLGGRDEAEAVRSWAEALSQDTYQVLSYRFINQRNDPPRLLAVQRRTA